MGIRRVEMYQAFCDNCGKVPLDLDGIIAWTDANSAIEVVLAADWEQARDEDVLLCVECSCAASEGEDMDCNA